MARQKNEGKRHAILAAATEAIAKQGVGASTAQIAKAAGIAEGTLFIYFANKDQLLNQLYLHLKDDLKAEMMADYPREESVKNKIYHVWDTYVTWGHTNPTKRHVLAKLGLSGHITEQNKGAGMSGFLEIIVMTRESMQKGLLRQQPPEFVAAIMGSIAEATLDFMAANLPQHEVFKATGFEAFWAAIEKK